MNPLAFEGSEKKVEIILAPGASLRPMRQQWEKVVAASGATILSSLSNPCMDAYLLSESSLFVYDRAAIMITCGTISLVEAVEEMCRFIPPDEIRMLMYERKNEYFPDQQPTQFDDDVVRLQEMFPGDVADLGSLGGHHIRLYHHAKQGFQPPHGDMTLEILMHDLSDEVRALFGRQDLTRELLYEATGIQQILPEVACDDYLFKPMGYSLNATNAEDYYTIHVTPEDICSYASFETNYTFDGDIEAMVERVLAIFQPTNFSLLFFNQEQPELEALKGYSIQGVEDSHYHGYHVRFRNYTRQ